jgi:hypothetical protein
MIRTIVRIVRFCKFTYFDQDWRRGQIPYWGRGVEQQPQRWYNALAIRGSGSRLARTVYQTDVADQYGSGHNKSLEQSP